MEYEHLYSSRVYDIEAGELTDVSPEEVGPFELPRIPSGFDMEGADIVIRIRRMHTSY